MAMVRTAPSGTTTKTREPMDAERATAVATQITEGHLDQILLGQDGRLKNCYKHNGGLGYDHPKPVSRRGGNHERRHLLPSRGGEHGAETAARYPVLIAAASTRPPTRTWPS